ncbi:MAG TPA: CBS domain-containing protein [Polyangia bacterium]|nr:CBS domain-containing protein [Polyangia bacterium]
MPDHIDRLGEFSEQGRGVPVSLSRPAGALPFSPLVRQAYAPSPIARLGWAQGLIRCGEVPLEPARAIDRRALVSSVARLLAERGGFVPVVERERFVGVVYVEDLLEAVADKLDSPTVAGLVSPQIPTCSPASALVDAVRAMLACYLLRIPVVGDRGELVGLLSLSVAAAAGERDPAVRDVLEAALSPSLFARAWR